MTADVLLSKLDGVRRTGSETWIARCPAHADKRPSLSIRETTDGRVLLHCWTGCSAGDVVAAVGLQLGDLFPPRERGRPDHQFAHGERRPFPAADVLRAVVIEMQLVAIEAGRIGRGEVLTDDDRARVLLAASRLSAAADLAGVTR